MRLRIDPSKRNVNPRINDDGEELPPGARAGLLQVIHRIHSYSQLGNSEHEGCVPNVELSLPPRLYFSSVIVEIFALVAFDVTTSALNFQSTFGSMTDW